MKTKKQTLIDNKEYKTLINAVLNRIQLESVEDVNRAGAAAGFGGFTYYYDTVKFAMRHRKQIIKMLECQAEEFGVEVVEMVAGFGVFRNNGIDADEKRDLYRYLSGAKCKDVTIPNLMAWYALEEVCRMFED